ncbi:DNA-binding response regulator, partial [Streptomyces sp. TRM76130]|nr:DNA-binding response regulator [Streptomyces sp. TRM76130]
LMSPLALADEAGREHLRAMADAGARVRIAGTALPHETIVIDHRYAILAGPATPARTGGREYTVTSVPAVVGGVYSLFEAVWEAATGLDAFLCA